MCLALAILALVLSAGCRRDVGSLDEEERSDPYVQEALRRHREGSIDDAMALYQEALDRNPTLARAHLDLAQLLHDYKKDYVRAIYHYNRYMELRPGTEKQAMIKGRMQQAGQLYAATFFRTETHAAEKVASLERENLELKEELEHIQEELREMRRRLERKGEGTKKNSIRATHTYQVQSGDTLISIAEDLYRDKNKWQLIYDANRDQIGESMSLRDGQVLKVP